mgnify:CR=1 FL=1
MHSPINRGGAINNNDYSDESDNEKQLTTAFPTKSKKLS